MKPPSFKRMDLDDNPNNIGKIQTEFEILNGKLNRLVGNCPEKTIAFRKLQEACFFLCRAESVAHYRYKDDKPGKSVYKTQTSYDGAEIKRERKQPTIVLKKKKL